MESTMRGPHRLKMKYDSSSTNMVKVEICTSQLANGLSSLVTHDWETILQDKKQT